METPFCPGVAGNRDGFDRAANQQDQLLIENKEGGEDILVHDLEVNGHGLCI